MSKAILLSLISFCLLAFAYPPYPLGFGALIFLAPWFYVLKTAPKKTVLLSTYLGAFLFYVISLYWIYHVGEVAPPALIYTGVFLMIAYLSLYTMLCAWVFVKIRDLRFGKFSALLLFPFFWAGIEVFHSKGDMSFPWFSLGLVFGNSFEMIQSFALFGVFGVSAIIIASNMCLAEALLHKKKILACVPIAAFAILYAGGFACIKYGENTDLKEDADSLTITIVQPSIPQTEKWSRAYYDSVMGQTWNLFETLDPSNIDLIVFPETAIPDFMNLRHQEYDYLHNYAVENNTAIVMGALSRTANKNKRRKFDIYNSAFLFGYEHPVLEFRKTHLVPFSEKIPYNEILPIDKNIDFGAGNFSPGDSLFIWQPGNFSPLICYEAIYGSIVRNAKRSGAKFIANITNDGWFKRSIAPYQHFNLVRAHAVENGIGVVRAANTGISAFIEANGKITGKTELFEIRTLTDTMPTRTRFTPYFIIGDYIEYALLALIAFTLLLPVFKKGR